MLINKNKNMSKGNYILYQISKSKKYDLELVEEEAKKQGKIKGNIEFVLSLHKRDYTPEEISHVLNIPLQEVNDIIENKVKI